MITLKEFTGLQYHNELNPALWDDYKLVPEVEKKLKSVAKEFIDFLKMDKSLITDVIITGSSANFNWSNYSDIDLHVVAKFTPEAKDSVGITVMDTFNNLRNQFNFNHQIKIHGIPVETYVQPDTAEITSNAGVYSLTHGKWLKTPVNEHVVYNEKEIEAKAKPLRQAIKQILSATTADMDAVDEIKNKIWQMRAAGLKSGGEYSLENLVFKSLRNAGLLTKLLGHINKIKDNQLSL